MGDKRRTMSDPLSWHLSVHNKRYHTVLLCRTQDENLRTRVEYKYEYEDIISNSTQEFGIIRVPRSRNGTRAGQARA